MGRRIILLFLQSTRVDNIRTYYLDYCFKFVRDTAKTWLRLPYLNKVRFQNMIFDEKAFFNGKKFGTTKLANVYAINQESGGKKSQMVDKYPKI